MATAVRHSLRALRRLGVPPVADVASRALVCVGAEIAMW